MLVENLPSPLRERLRNAGVEIKCKVVIEVTTLQVMPNGSYGTGLATYRFDISDRLIEWPQISLQGPRFPLDDRGDDFSVNAISCQIRLSNTDRIFAVAQDDAVLSTEWIEQAKVWIYADVGGTLVNWFGGRVNGRPTETAGVTTFEVLGHLWEAIRKPVVYEQFGLIGGRTQTIYGGDSGLTTTDVHIPAIGQGFCSQQGLVAYDAGGRKVARFKRIAGTGVNLQSLRLSNGMSLGKYTITFKSHAGYTLRCPDNTLYTGNRFRGLPEDSPIQIDRDDWTSGGDALGCEFEFWVNWTAEGNGVAMAYHLIEKALLQNAGVVSGLPSAMIDVNAFRFWAQRFASFRVFVDATNTDNSVFEGKSKNRPLEYMTLAQRILAHYQCSLTILIDGQISIQGPYLDNRPAWSHTSATEITGESITIEGGESINYIKINYGGDPDGGYAVPITRDLNPNAPQRVEKVFSLPYIKVGVGDRFALWWERMCVRRYMRRQSLIKYTVDPAHGLLLCAGDYVTVISSELPRINQRAMIVSVNRTLGGECQVVAAMVQDGEGDAAIVGVAEVGGVGVW